MTELQKIAERDNKWQALAFMLERKWPNKWGKKEKVEAAVQHTGKDGGPIQHESKIDLSKLTYEELEVLEKIVVKQNNSNLH